MNKELRKAVIAGNWKMNKTPVEAAELINEMKPLVENADCDVVICVPYVDLQTALYCTEGTNIKVGAENCHWEEKGAFTGEISPSMLTSMGVEYVVIGHLKDVSISVKQTIPFPRELTQLLRQDLRLFSV